MADQPSDSQNIAVTTTAKSADEQDFKTSGNKTWYVTACSVLASTNSVLFGYDVGVMSGAVLFIKKDLHISDFQVEMLISSLNFISLLGSALAGKTSDWIGRRLTMFLAAIIFMLGAVFMAVAPNFGILMLGRLVSGVGVGYCLMIAPVYTAEVAPSMTRGAFSCFPEIFVNVGILIGYIVNFSLKSLPSNINWRIMLGLGAAPTLFIAAAVLIMPESPRWLVLKGRHEAAQKVLFKTLGSEAEAKYRLDEIVEGIEYARKKAGGKSSEGSWMEILRPSPVVRRMLIAALGIQFFHQATGTDSTVYYSPKIFDAAGITSEGGKLGATIAVGVAKLGFTLVACGMVDRVGRRVLLLTSTIGLTVALIVLAGSLEIVRNTNSRAAGYVAVIATCLDVGMFSIGIGPVNWVLGAEIYPLRIRAKAASLGVAVNRCMSGIISLTFLTISKGITVPGTFFMFSGVGVLAITFVYFLVPETKGKSLEEIVAYLNEVTKGKEDPAKLMELADSKAPPGVVIPMH